MTVTTGQAARQAGEPIAAEPIAGEPACPGRRARRWERALLIGGGLAAGWLLAVQVRQIELTALLAAARPAWAAVAVALVAASFLGAAWSLMGFSTVRLRLAPTVLVQIAGGFAKVFSPAALGTALVNARYLRCAGASRSQVLTSIGTVQLAQFGVTVAVLGVLVTVRGSVLDGPLPGPGDALVVVGIGVAALAAVWFGRRHLRVRAVLLRARAEVCASVRHVVREPGRAALGLTGSAVLLLAFTLGLASSVRAFGGGVDLLSITVVFLAGSAAGSVVPTPGGLGTVEAALVTGLVATGLAPAVAVPAVLWFRLVSVWLPVPLGWVAFQVLRHRALL